jgi:hypothetical protein
MFVAGLLSARARFNRPNWLLSSSLTRIAAAMLAVAATTASAAAGPAEDFLSGVLTHDFQGDSAFRIGKMTWSAPNQPADGECDCAPPRKSAAGFDSAMVIVAGWKLAASQPSASGIVVVSADFRVVATAKGEGVDGERRWHVVPVSPRDERISYRLRLDNGAWRLVDPPLPRMNVACVVKEVQTALQRHPPEERRTRKQQDSYGWLSGQLDLLESVPGAAEKGICARTVLSE